MRHLIFTIPPGLALALLMALGPAPAPAPAAGPPPSRESAEEQVLARAGVPSDDRALLDWLRWRSPTPADRAALERLVEDLGADDFDAREAARRRLGTVGPAAVPALERATKGKDTEAARLATQLLVALRDATAAERGPAPVAECVIRLLVRRRTAGAAGAILRYLPAARRPAAEEEAYYGLDDLAAADPATLGLLEEALADGEPARRAVAACILGRVGDGRQRAGARGRLADADAKVRLRAAQGLLAGREKDRAAIPALIGLLDEPAVEVTWQAEELLHYAAGDLGPREVVGANGPAERARCQAAWRRWWAAWEPHLSLTRLDDGPRRPGLVMTYEKGDGGSETQPSRLRVLGCDSATRFELHDRKGYELVKWAPAGAFLGAGGGRLSIRSLEGTTVSERVDDHFRDVSDVRLLDDGVTAICSHGWYAEIDRTGTTVRQTRLATEPPLWRPLNRFGWDGRIYRASPAVGSNEIPGLGKPPDQWNDLITASSRLAWKDPLSGREGHLQVDAPGVIAMRPCDWMVSAPGGSLMWVYGRGYRHEVVRFDLAGGKLGEFLAPWPTIFGTLRSGGLLVRWDQANLPALVEVDSAERPVWGASPMRDRLQSAEVVYPLIRFGFLRPLDEKMNITARTNLVAATASLDSQHRAWAVATLGSGPVSGADSRMVGARLRDPALTVRVAALMVLAAGDRTPEEVVDGLTRFLEGEESDHRWLAVEALRKAGPSGLPPLLAALSNTSGRGARDRRQAALRGIAYLAGRGNGQAIQALRQSFRNSDATLRTAAAVAVYTHAPAGEAFIPDLWRMANDEDEDVRYAALHALGYFPTTRAAVVDRFLKLLGSPGLSDRSLARAVSFLSEGLRNHPRALPGLLEHGGPTSSPRVRAAVIRSLAQFGPRQEVLDAISLALRDERTVRGSDMEAQKVVRRAALLSLEELGPKAKVLAHDVAKIAADRNEVANIRKLAIAVLVNFDDTVKPDLEGNPGG